MYTLVYKGFSKKQRQKSYFFKKKSFCARVVFYDLSEPWVVYNQNMAKGFIITVK